MLIIECAWDVEDAVPYAKADNIRPYTTFTHKIKGEIDNGKDVGRQIFKRG